ncbi:hypothetical protein [Hyalangium sp.]|uniref:hypothetical protein n=1 Tax=Hyalangium sp. TaxID=2028555 RepID=UPI002D63A161|nr:hypothetical protein [Hyalangium sp.]HYH95896.1 hypothetical protein [Hyalangium sp.]
MTDSSALSDPQEVIGKQWSKNSSPERRQLLELARDALFFISDTGLRHRFEDFRESLTAGVPPRAEEIPAASSAPELVSLQERLNCTREFFTTLLDEAESMAERGLIQIILDTLHFIAGTGQASAFSEYLKHVAASGPPYAVASFGSREEAELWLQSHPHPPVSANILVANAYHDVVHDRVTGIRRLPRNRDLEYYLAGHRRANPPTAVASFSRFEDADAWLQSQPKPASWAWVSIAGEPYLAAYYPNLDHRALYPLSLADGYEMEIGDSPQQ